MLRKTAITLLFSFLLLACSNNKNLAQRRQQNMSDTLLQNINASKNDTEIINPQLQKLQRENDLVIAFGTLNYAWARKGTYYVLANKDATWKLYTYTAKLPPTPADAAMEISPQNVSVETAEKIKNLYAASELWKTNGDGDETPCAGKKDCNINDAETWTLSIATSKNIHTTTYYAAEFFEECCPGNPYRQRFIALAHEIMKLGKNAGSAPEK